jgi:hypothetical protein
MQGEIVQAALTEGLVWEVPTQPESGTIPSRDMSAQLEAVGADALPDAEGVCTNEAEPQSGDATGGNASAPKSLDGSCLNLVVRNPGPRLPRSATLGDLYQPPSPWMWWIRGPLNWGCHVTPACHPRPPPGGRWCVHRLQPLSICCDRQYPWSDQTSCIQSGSVLKKERVLPNILRFPPGSLTLPPLCFHTTLGPRQS